MLSTTARVEKELAKLRVARIQDVLVARLVVREEATRLGFPPQALTQICTAVSEVARNVVQHAGVPGELRIAEFVDGSRHGLHIVVEDTGAGIPDLSRALLGSAPGAGIPGCRHIMDDFEIQSQRGVGTTVAMSKWLPVH